MKDIEDTQNVKLNFPIIADSNQKVANLYSMIQSEDNKKVVIRNVADGTLTTYQKNNIKERLDAGSLMPPGITASLDTTELRDLIKYLSNLKSKSFNKTTANENVKGKE